MDTKAVFESLIGQARNKSSRPVTPPGSQNQPTPESPQRSQGVQRDQSSPDVNQGVQRDQSSPDRSQEDPKDDSLNQYFPEYMRPLPEETLFEWQAASRPFKKHTRQYYTTMMTIVLLVCLILFFASQLLPMAVVLAVTFLAYVMTSVPPHTITNKLTTYGIKIDDQTFYWEEMGRFWFEDKYQDRLLKVEVARFPHRLVMVVNRDDEKTLREIISEVLFEEKPKPTYYENLAAWFQEKIPLDFDGKSQSQSKSPPPPTEPASSPSSNPSPRQN